MVPDQQYNISLRSMLHRVRDTSALHNLQSYKDLAC